jgi:hypothetical protein
VKLFLILVLRLRQFFIVRIFVKRATVPLKQKKRPVFPGSHTSTNGEKETRYVQYGQILLQYLNINDSFHLKDLEISKYQRESKGRMPIIIYRYIFVNCCLICFSKHLKGKNIN